MWRDTQNANDLTNNLVSLGRRESPLAPFLFGATGQALLPLKEKVMGSSPIRGTKGDTWWLVAGPIQLVIMGSIPISSTNGALVKLVIMPPCHGGVHGFESRTYRKQSKVIA